MSNHQSVLKIEDLTISYKRASGEVDAVRDFSIALEKGQTYGLVGESGSGKSTLALAVMTYLNNDGFIKSGTIHIDGSELADNDQEQLRKLWGSTIAHVPQNPFTALNPSLRIGDQLAESLRAHNNFSDEETANRVVELFEKVRLADPERVATSYPHQISGGMQQRVMIALALSSQPRLLVLDEPTTALDVTTQAVVLDLIRDLTREQSTSTLYVTHNLGVVANITDRVAVLYASELVEDAPTEDLYRQPLHPYTRGLLDSVPRLGQRKDEAPLQGIAGQIPSLDDLPSACVFAPRCPVAIDICWEQRPALESATPDRRVRCHRWPEILAGELNTRRDELSSLKVESFSPEPILSIDNLGVAYPQPRSFTEWLGAEPAKTLRAVDGISLEVTSRQTIGIVGESGSGKSSLARALIGLVEPDAGSVELLVATLPANLKLRDKETLSQLQMIFQNPDEALNPYLTVGESLRRPLISLKNLSSPEAQMQAIELLAKVRLPSEYLHRLPGQLSGGEKQRVAVARAFATNPDLLIADESVSALDVSVQAAILNLLIALQIDNNTAMLFIAHDIAVVGYLADLIAVMYLGQLMQFGDATSIFDPPYHPYTEALLSAVPPPDPSVEQERIRLSGDVPSAIDRPSGCPFHTRCPRFLGDICIEQAPPWQEGEDGKRIYCHIPIEELKRSQSPVLRFDLSGQQGQSK